jgi:hypothetical protein
LLGCRGEDIGLFGLAGEEYAARCYTGKAEKYLHSVAPSDVILHINTVDDTPDGGNLMLKPAREQSA